MASRKSYDAVVIGSGPNGLAAAITLAREGLSTLTVEAKATMGGGARTEALTLPGFAHDVCSTVHPLGIKSPFFSSLDLQRFGLVWVQPTAPLVHVIDETTTVTLERSLAATAAGLGADGDRYRDLLGPVSERFDELMRMFLGPLRWPASPLLAGRFGLKALSSLTGLAKRRFRYPAAPALLAGIAAHAMLPLDRLATASFALVLAAAGHAGGWPLAKGGSESITRALAACLRGLGGEIQLDTPVRSLGELPRAQAYLFDLTPRQLLEMGGTDLPSSYRRRLGRFRYGPGVFKIDWALRAPIPWRDPARSRAATVHLAGSMDAVAKAESEVHQGRVAAAPFTLLVQPTLFDPSRAPAGAHTAWAYCHVPARDRTDLTSAIEAQIERFAPGFGALVLARSTRDTAALEAYDQNYVGGDINGGLANLGQLFFRPVASLDPYATPVKHVYLCSSSTPPGGGVHGMCGHWAARSALERVFGITETEP